MIFTELTNTNPMVLNGMAIKVNSTNIKVPNDEYSPEFCYCLYECNTPTEVWGGGEGWQNDKTTFLFKRQITSDTGLFKIYKNDSLVATITDDSYGKFKSAYTSDALQYSFIADWNLIFNAFGNGSYVIKNTYTSIGVAKEFESNTFNLSQYSDEMANGYVKFTWTQKGYIESSDFNFNDGVDFSYKLKGVFALSNPETIKDSYKTSTYSVNQFRTEQKNKYLFSSKLINQSDFNTINENLALADAIEVVDFNIFGTNFREKELSFEEISNFDPIVNIRSVTLNIQFTDYEQNKIKTNC